MTQGPSKTALDQQPGTPGLTVPGTRRPGMAVLQTGMIASQGMIPGVTAVGTQGIIAPGVQRPGMTPNMGQMPGITVSHPGTAMGLTGR